MAYTLCPFEERQYFDDNGDPLAFGKVNTYLSGTTTPVFTFSDSTGTLNANPVVLSASGRCRIYLDPLLAYKFIVTDANDVPVGLTMDPVSLNLAALAAQSFLGSTRGSVAAPVFSFVPDTNTGIYSSAEDTLDIATGGAQRVRFHPTGGVSVGDVTNPGALNFRVAGAIYLVGSAAVTTNALENRSGSLYFNNVALATGGSLSGTTGKLAKFTGSSTVGDSIVSESGTTITVAGTAAATTFSGSGASLTALPAGQLSGTIPNGTQDLITRLGTIVSGVWNAGAVTSSGGISGTTLKAGAASFEAAVVFQTSATGSQSLGTMVVTNAAANARVWDTFGGTTTLSFRAVADAYASANNWMVVTRDAGAATIASVSFPSNVAIGGSNVTDAVTTPTIASGFGSSPSIAGKTFAFIITCGLSGVSLSGVVNFGTTFTNAPVVSLTAGSGLDPDLQASTTTTQLTISGPAVTSGGEKIYVLVRGY